MARPPSLPYSVTFQSPRKRRARSLAIGVVIAALLIVFTGPVSQGIGVSLLVLVAWFQGRPLLATLRNPPGQLKVEPSVVILPRGLHSGDPIEVPPQDLEHVYFLRHAVSFSQGAPLLVVETGEHTLVYPRDWFADPEDQERVYQALRIHDPSA